MAYDPKPGEGAIFPNKYKADGDKKPSLKGHIYVHKDLKAGDRIELALWPHRTGGGFTIKSQDPRSLSEEVERPAKQVRDDIEEVPF